MFGVGLASAAMNSVLKNNRNLLRKKSIFKNEERFLRTNPDHLQGIRSKITVQKISAKQLKNIRTKTQKEQKKEIFKISMFILLSIAILIILFFTLLTPTPQERELANIQLAAKNTAIFEQKKAEFLFFIEDGDTWLKSHKYHNAIFQYKKALEVFPSEYDAHYRLAVAYSFQCQYEFKGCKEGAVEIRNMEKQLSMSSMSYAEIFTKREEIRKIKQVFEHWGE